MANLVTYRLKSESPDALWAMLRDASAGKATPFAWNGLADNKLFDEARVLLPRAETVPGATEEITDPETGTVFLHVPQMATGNWLCEVMLVDEDDSDLAAIAHMIEIMVIQ